MNQQPVKGDGGSGPASSDGRFAKEEVQTKEAIRALYELYSNDIYRYARMTLCDSGDAYDVVQEVFVRALRSWPAYRQDAQVKTWLMSIARNYMVDLLRKKRTERRYITAAELPDVGDPSTAMDVVMEIQDALHQLKDNYRQVVILRHIENLSLQETATILGWSQNRVRNATHRAVKKLQEILSSTTGEVNIKHDVRA